VKINDDKLQKEDTEDFDEDKKETMSKEQKIKPKEKIGPQISIKSVTK
jgi:hypothetical protein